MVFDSPPDVLADGTVSGVACNGRGPTRRLFKDGPKTYKSFTCYVAEDVLDPSADDYPLGTATFRLTVTPTDYDEYVYAGVCDLLGDGRDYPRCRHP